MSSLVFHRADRRDDSPSARPLLDRVRPMNRPLRPHRGLTILEVLIAMGIALFGLIAVMAIVPYAARQAQDGLEMEVTSQVGQRALGDVAVYDLVNPQRWITTAGPLPQTAGFFNSFPHFIEPAGNPPYDPNPALRFHHDEAVLIDPLFYGVNPVVSHFPYCYAPQGFIEDGSGVAIPFRDPLVIGGLLPSFTHHLDSNGDPYESIAPFVRRVGLANPGATIPSLLPTAAARAIFETSDDVVIRPLNQVEVDNAAALGQGGLEKFTRLEYFEGIDPTLAAPNNVVGIREFSEGSTSWLAMVAPENDDRTLWKLYIIVVKDRDPTFSINATNERVARIRGTLRYPADHGFLGGGIKGGTVRLESWGSTNALVSAAVDPTTAMLKDIAIEPNQWVLLSRFDQFPGQTPAARRRYQWYRVTDVGNEIFPSPADTRAAGGVPAPVPSRFVTLTGPDWDPGPDALVFVMNGVEAIYERTIRLPAGSFRTPQPSP